jgi:hypothetical protein
VVILTFKEFLQEKYGTTGTYAAYKFSASSKRSIAEYMTDTKVPNPIDPDKLHVTLLYSRKPMVGFMARGDLSDPIQVFVTGFDVWDTQDGAKALVARLDAPQVVARHKELMDTFNGTYDFPEYKPHTTLSYNVSTEFDQTSLPAFRWPLYLATEYGSNLDTGWKAD